MLLLKWKEFVSEWNQTARESWAGGELIASVPQDQYSFRANEWNWMCQIYSEFIIIYRDSL